MTSLPVPSREEEPTRRLITEGVWTPPGPLPTGATKDYSPHIPRYARRLGSSLNPFYKHQKSGLKLEGVTLKSQKVGFAIILVLIEKIGLDTLFCVVNRSSPTIYESVVVTRSHMVWCLYFPSLLSVHVRRTDLLGRGWAVPPLDQGPATVCGRLPRSGPGPLEVEREEPNRKKWS